MNILTRRRIAKALVTIGVLSLLFGFLGMGFIVDGSMFALATLMTGVACGFVGLILLLLPEVQKTPEGVRLGYRTAQSRITTIGYAFLIIDGLITFGHFFFSNIYSPLLNGITSVGFWAGLILVIVGYTRDRKK